MAEGIKEQVNELARVIFRKKEAGTNCNVEYGQIYHILSKWSIMDGRKIFKIRDDDIYSCAFHDAMMKSFDIYDGTRDFLPLYKTVYENIIKDELRREAKHKNVLSLDDNCFNNSDDDNSQVSNYNIVADEKQNIDDLIDKRETIRDEWLLKAAISINIKKIKKNKYVPLFFTDRLVYSIFIGNEYFDGFIQEESNKFDEAVTNEFMNTLLTGECSSVTEIKNYKCRPLSEFTGEQKDDDKSCCEEKSNYYVFNSYLKDQGKGITQSAFSQQKSKCLEMLHISEK